ncbi:flagellar basal body P-ring formation chaperone FlgA [Celeribacter neptunius]|uniref:Flagella basal body P-ring formation protein FlgA n=1 Tax=Celeribacter neptunius TaxID=588602 RepID=A0A1I3SRW0_9RHOB|nr:flagellar basal body P-ring formation chaperone FlgA [Celeribacter neptunius]SFJ61508.1 flagella basal body P-ring formation protein FlgA [Celeribacter neptunius]
MIKHLLISCAIVLMAQPALAETVVAARTIRAQTVLTAGDLSTIEEDLPGTLSSIEEAIGQEARVMLYSGRPVSINDIGPAAIIERNQIVPLIYSHGGLRIAADGRALDRASVGDVVRVMNLSSKTTVSGVVAADGTIHVGGLATH